jgi:hypothetical protein
MEAISIGLEPGRGEMFDLLQLLSDSFQSLLEVF